jgi:hypothetical protein
MDQIKVTQAGMLRTNLRGQIRQTPLPHWKALLPLFEAVMNSFQAIQDAKTERAHSITIEVERDSGGLFNDENPDIIGFTIRDTGVGFNDENFDSFNTAYSDHKYERGGKGLGRFMWLKAFDKVEIKSVFLEQDHDELPSFWKREFQFNYDYDPDNAPAVPTSEQEVETVVRLFNFQKKYREQCPRDVDQLSLRLAEHFILVLMQPDCPKVEIVDKGLRHSLNRVFKDHFALRASDTSFEVGGRVFTINGFRLTAPRATKHRLIYAANSRGVVTEMLDQFMPNLIGRLEDEGGKSFAYLAVVQGDYLNEKVNNFRTDFEMNEDPEQGEISLLPEDLKRSDIRDRCVEFISHDLQDMIEGLNKAKTDRITHFVHSSAPQYKPLLRYLPGFVDQIAPNATKTDIELALHKELHKREVALKRESGRILTEAARLADYDGYRERLSHFLEQTNELGASALAQYVMHRKTILELFEKALAADRKTDKYPLEQAVHNILFPMRATDRDVLYSQQNLWIIDERLTYHWYVTSDKPLKSHEELQSTSSTRPDLFIFDRRMSFSEGDSDSPITSLVVVEFKRPQRDNYTGDDNPLQQVFDQIKEIRKGRFLNEDKRPISTANEKIPASAYVIADITPSLREILDSQDMQSTPDGLSYYGYHKNFAIYYEVIDYNRLLADAKRRNRAFFDKLNLMTSVTSRPI